MRISELSLIYSIDFNEMKITSRPSMHPNKGYENVVSDGCPHEVDRVRFEKTSDLSDRESPVVVFRCYGKPGTTHNSNVP